MLRTIGRKILVLPPVRKSLSIIVDFYNNLPVNPIPEMLKINTKGRLPQFHVGSVMSFGETDIIALNKITNMVLKYDMVVAEVGSWTGSSTHVLAKNVVGHNGKVYAVDTFAGSATIPEYEFAKEYSIFSIFQSNMEILGIDKVVHPLVMPSQEAVKIIADKTFDLVFIDADHRYKQVKEDILRWMPKVKDGGIICGHDCEMYYSDLSESDKKRVNENLDIDCIKDLCHSGVVKALYEIFNDTHIILKPSVLWYKRV